MSTIINIDSSIAYPLVIGCSLFGIAWGVVNVFAVSIMHASAAFYQTASFLSWPITGLSGLKLGTPRK